MLGLLVDVFAVADGRGQDFDLVVLDNAQDPVVADPVTPELPQFPLECLAEHARIFCGGHALTEVVHNAPRGLLVHFFQGLERPV